MFKNFFPNKIFLITNKILNFLVFILIIFFAIGLVYSLVLSPQDYIQGHSVRIMYVHVPSSFLALGIFACIGIGSILSLVFKIKFMPLMAKPD